MEVEGKEQVIYSEGFTLDIVNACVAKWDEIWPACRELAESLKADTIEQSCKNIYDFLLSNIHYKVDPAGVQWIRTPARLIYDSEGDCKSYSLLIASCLRCLDIDCAMRFVSYDNTKEYTHVYVVARDESGNEIKVDPVAYVQLSIPFNQELKYKNKLDMKGTKISYLSGVGSNDPDSTFSEQITNNTKQNVNYLKSAIRYLEALISINYKDSLNCLLFCYLYKTMIRVINEFGDIQSDLQTAGYVLARRVTDGEFSVSFDTLEEFDTYFRQLSDDIVSEIFSYSSNSVNREQYVLSPDFEKATSSFMDFWNNNILNFNTVFSMSSNDAEFAGYLEECAPFFLYTVVPPDVLPGKAKEKEVNQELILEDFLSSSGITLLTAKNIIRTGIILASGMDETDALNSLAGKKVQGIGDTEGTVNIISDIVNGAADAFSKVYTAVKAGQSSSKSTYIPTALPQTSDFSNNTMLYVVGGGLLLLLLFSSKKKSKA